MARGFESKQVESQQEEAARPKSPGRRLTSEEVERLQQERILQLSRTRLAADLESATHANHRRMLEQALAAVDEQLRALADDSPR
jgi:hypothetical protein